MSNKICITRDIDGIERVEKITSLNPDKYVWKDFYVMLNKYSLYCYQIGINQNISELKTFKEWLDDEI